MIESPKTLRLASLEHLAVASISAIAETDAVAREGVENVARKPLRFLLGKQSDLRWAKMPDGLELRDTNASESDCAQL